MLRPTAEALERLDDFRATGVADLGWVHVERSGRAGIVELRNPRALNAEDDQTLHATEVAIDLVLLDPEIEVGVLRGGVLEHPRYAGRRIFGAGINLTRLYHGKIPYLFFLVRDLGPRQQDLPRPVHGPSTTPTSPRTRSRSCGSPRSTPTRSAAAASSCTWSTT